MKIFSCLWLFCPDPYFEAALMKNRITSLSERVLNLCTKSPFFFGDSNGTLGGLLTLRFRVITKNDKIWIFEKLLKVPGQRTLLATRCPIDLVSLEKKADVISKIQPNKNQMISVTLIRLCGEVNKPNLLWLFPETKEKIQQSDVRCHHKQRS